MLENKYANCLAFLTHRINNDILRRTRQTLWGGRTDANPKLSLNDI